MTTKKEIPSDGSFDFLNFKDVIDPLNTKGIISSTQLKDWQNVSQVKQFPGKIAKQVIPLDFAFYRMSIVTKVEPGVVVETHMHEEPVFRYVVEGKLELNGIKHEVGDWVLVPSRTPYRVVSPIGYTVLASYGAKCGSPHDDVVLRRDEVIGG